VTAGAVVGVLAIGSVGYAIARSDEKTPVADLSDARTTADHPTTTTIPASTTTTLPALIQPKPTLLPAIPPDGLGPGASGEVVRAYQQRLVDVHFDPGAIDGKYGSGMTYAVQALQKIMGVPRTGRLGAAESSALATFQYPQPLQPTGEANRTEVDVTKQVITLYENYQVRLITTTSTGSGERYCYSTPRVNPTRRICEDANTPSGRFTYTEYRDGWDKSPLGQLYNPFYFNGGIAVHGYESVPTSPASHGCARIPMHIAEYFPTIVKRGDAVYVFGGSPGAILSRESLVPTTTPIMEPTTTTAAPTTAAPTTTTTTTSLPPTSTTCPSHTPRAPPSTHSNSISSSR
jgi:peptidoglycan hydrolase-like protein with peptidoglycan-binding domain